MGMKSTTQTTWECDRCDTVVVSVEMPSTEHDPWGKVMIDQPSGFDAQGHPWAPRMREPVVLCGNCVEDVVTLINRKIKRKTE